MRIEHGGDSIIAEPVHSILVQIPAEVGQKETKSLPLCVVEDTRIPETVITLYIRVEMIYIYMYIHTDYRIAGNFRWWKFSYELPI